MEHIGEVTYLGIIVLPSVEELDQRWFSVIYSVDETKIMIHLWETVLDKRNNEAWQ